MSEEWFVLSVNKR